MVNQFSFGKNICFVTKTLSRIIFKANDRIATLESPSFDTKANKIDSSAGGT